MNYKDKMQMGLIYEQKQITERFVRQTLSLPINEQQDVVVALWEQLDDAQKDQLINEFNLGGIMSGLKNIGGGILNSLGGQSGAGGIAGQAASAAGGMTGSPAANSMTQAPGGATGQAGGFLQGLLKLIPPQAYQGLLQKIMSFLPMDKIMPIIQSFIGGNNAGSTSPTATPAAGSVPASVKTEQYLKDVYNQLNESQQQELLEFWGALLGPAASALGGVLGKQKQGWAKKLGGTIGGIGDKMGGGIVTNLMNRGKQQGQPQQGIVGGGQMDGLFQAAAQLMQSNPAFAQQMQQLIQKFSGQGAGGGQQQMARTAMPTSYNYGGRGIPK